MNITIKAKKIGSKRMLHLPIILEIFDEKITLKNFLELVVKSEVAKFNQKKEQAYFLTTLLDTKAIEEQALVGKIGFNVSMDKKLANYDKAIETMLLAYKDGLFKVFIDGNEYDKLDENINIKEGSEAVFIRLTFLAGGYF